MRSRSSAPTRKRRPRRGRASPSPARRARRSAGRPAMPPARNMASSAARSWSGPSAGAARVSARRGSARRVGRLSQKTAEDVIVAVGRGELSSADVIRAVWPEEAPAETPKKRRKVKRAEEGWFGLGKVMGLKFRWPGSSGRSRPAGASQHSDPGLAGRPPGQLRRRRRRPRRPHRRHPQPRPRHHHLSHPCRSAEGLRRGARALDRRDLGHRRGQPAALSRQDRRHGPE